VGRKTLTKGKMEIIEELSIKEWDGPLDIQPNYTSPRPTLCRFSSMTPVV
jgi:hypothetical protein